MSDETKHTPGPWRVYPVGSCVPHYDVCPRVVSDHPSGRSVGDPISDADADLIAAAPDLLEALEELADLMEAVRTGDYRPDSFTTQPANLAIAKAKGVRP